MPVICGKIDQNLTDFFRFIYFPRKYEFRPQKTNNYELKNVNFPPETKYDVIFFVRLLVWGRFKFSKIWQYFKNGVILFSFKIDMFIVYYSLWYIKIFVSCYFSKISHIKTKTGAYMRLIIGFRRDFQVLKAYCQHLSPKSFHVYERKTYFVKAGKFLVLLGLFWESCMFSGV